MTTAHVGYDAADPLFHVGPFAPRVTIAPLEPLDVACEDAFSGRLTSPDDHPREVAPFPFVNPLTGPIAVEGAQVGDTIAIHIASVRPARDWGVATLSPSFGALSGTRQSPNLQPETGERVWIWQVEDESLVTTAASGLPMRVPLRPFLGTLGVAPAHGEVRTSVTVDAHGGNLDLPLLRAGSTLYLRINAPGALIHVGDGHLAQGDGELSGTAVESAVDCRLVAGLLPADPLSEWPRLETDDELVAIGVGRPLEEAFKVATHQLARWVQDISGLGVEDAFQLVSQACTARLGNLVNPSYTAAVSIPKAIVPGAAARTSIHDTLRKVRSA